jgi:hypothetical protein
MLRDSKAVQLSSVAVATWKLQGGVGDGVRIADRRGA